MKMKDDYTKDELLEIAKRIQRIIYGNISQVHSEAFQNIISHTTTESDNRAELLDNVNYIINSDNNLPDPIRRNEMLSLLFRLGSREDQIVKHSFKFKRPTLEDISGELKAIILEFGGLEATKEKISVIMGPYIIDETEFGRFIISMNFIDICKMYPGDNYLPRAIPLEPNYPKDNNDANPHPHISRGNICIGKAEVPMLKAMIECRLYDYFLMVDSILKTYGYNPYLDILAWTGQKCFNCENFYPLNGGENCEECGDESCPSCLTKCCDLSVKKCGKCSSKFRCIYCGEYLCAECSKVCVKCEQILCSGHIEISCHRCRKIKIELEF